ncbi:MAG: nuclear transport factor 2 family protein, partial [Gammaproteobacteria bacterium]
MKDRHAFRCAVEAGDLGGMIDLFRADAVLYSPVSFQPFRGKKAIGGLLFVLMEVFEDFRYTDELDAEDGTQALVFQAGVGGRELQGVDLLRFDDTGRIRELTVLVRPMSGLQA